MKWSVLAVVLLPLVAEARRELPRELRVPMTGTPSATCTVTEIQATKGERKGVDPRLEKLRAKLLSDAFAAYDTFVLLAESSLRAEKDRPVSSKLATRGTLVLLFKERLAPEKGKPRLRLSVDVDTADGKRALSTTLSVDSGSWNSPYAGEKLDKGAYILFLSCSAP